jgi:hypothetical protein
MAEELTAPPLQLEPQDRGRVAAVRAPLLPDAREMKIDLDVGFEDERTDPRIFDGDIRVQHPRSHLSHRGSVPSPSRGGQHLPRTVKIRQATGQGKNPVSVVA